MYDPKTNTFVCSCGCGTEIRFENEWIRGHNMRSPEMVERMSEYSSNRVLSSASREKLSKASSGRTLSPSHSESIRQGLLDAYRSDPSLAEAARKRALDAYKNDPTIQERQSEAASRRVRSPEEVERWSNVNVGRSRRPDECENVSKGLTEYYTTHPEMKVQISEAHKKNFQDPEFCTRWGRSHSNRPSGLEEDLLKYLEEDFPSLFKYTGDCKVWLNGRNPDFVCESRKLIIEVFGSYWHQYNDGEDRIQLYKELGYDCFIEKASSRMEIAIDYCDIKNWILEHLKGGPQ
jgi:hypothetical protein